ncbi:MAG: hypothetical protein RLZZ44_1709 [Bacteroidota bacterium]|jgi:hypothetical protein
MEKQFNDMSIIYDIIGDDDSWMEDFLSDPEDLCEDHCMAVNDRFVLCDESSPLERPCYECFGMNDTGRITVLNELMSLAKLGSREFNEESLTKVYKYAQLVKRDLENVINSFKGSNDTGFVSGKVETDIAEVTRWFNETMDEIDRIAKKRKIELDSKTSI